VVVLSDWSFLHPHELFRKLKSRAVYFNTKSRRWRAAGRPGPAAEGPRRLGKDADGPDRHRRRHGLGLHLPVNGHGPADNWTGLFAPGERVRLRFINSAAMTIFNVRIPGLSLEVVASDGQPVRPVSVDEFQIAPAETFDVIVRPVEDKAFTLVAEASDRSGLARATLAPRLGMRAASRRCASARWRP
jgi:FtsP/CotA-like multicopper oxidase with cupredoxin domain